MALRLLIAVFLVSCGGWRAGGSRPGADSTRTIHDVRYISRYIDRPPDEVYEFASDPRNLPRWATGLAGSIEQVNGEWIARSSLGSVKIRFAERNEFGVLDHDVVLESGVVVHNPMRVVPRGSGSEVVFTLFRQPDTSQEKFSEDARWVERDLANLERALE